MPVLRISGRYGCRRKDIREFMRSTMKSLDIPVEENADAKSI
jgi:hypothetical protein